jgi:hypothetical protein
VLTLGCGSSSDDSAPKSDAGVDVSVSDGGTDGSVDGGSDALIVLPDAEASLPTSAGYCNVLNWQKTYGGSAPGTLSNERANAVSADSTGAYITGNYVGDADFGGGPIVAGKDNRSLFVLALDQQAMHQWSRGFGDPSDGLFYAPQATGAAITENGDGNVIVAGSFAGSIDFGGGTLVSADAYSLADAGVDAGGGFCLQCAPDILVLALDGDGSYVWARHFGDEDGDGAEAVVAAGDVFVAGGFRGTLNAGSASETSAGLRDAFVMKLSAAGDPQWIAPMGGAGDDIALALVSDGAGGVFVGGQFSASVTLGGKTLSASGDNDGFIAHVDGSGVVSQARALGASQRGAIRGLARSDTGELTAVGFARGSVTLAGETHETVYDDALVLHLDAAGADAWAKVFGTNDNDSATAVSGLLVVGTLGHGSADLGGGLLGGNLYDGAFVLELADDGSHVCSRRLLATPSGEAVSEKVSVGAALDGLGIGGGFVTGALTGKTRLTDQELVSSGGTDALVFHLGPKPIP